MSLNVAARFAVQDVRRVPCPFATPGVVFHIARIGVKDYAEYAQKRLLANPMYAVHMRSQMKAQMVATRPTDEEWEKARKATGEKAAADLAKLEEREQKYVEVLTRATDKEMDKGFDLSSLDVARFLDPEGVAKYLIRDIEGLTRTGEDGVERAVKYTPVEGVELLSETVPIPTPIIVESANGGEPETVAQVGAQLGPALRAWVIAEASRSEKYREQFTEESGKN